MARNLFVALPLLALSLGCFALGMQRAWHDIEATAVATEVSFWGRSDRYFPAPATMAAALDAAQRLQRARQGSSEYAALLASVHYWHGQYLLEPSASVMHRDAALVWQRQSLQGRPAYRPAWERLGDYARAAGNGADQAQAADRLARLRATTN